MAEPPGDPRRAQVLRRLGRSPAAVVGLALTLTTVLAGLLAGVVSGSDPSRSVAPPLRAPSWAHLMGTDDLGRDIFSGVVHGARTSMIVAVSVIAITAAIGIPLGAVAGWRGGRWDDALMRVTELFQAVPLFFLAVLVVALFGAGVDNLVLVLGISLWPTLARVVRSEALSLREREFVEAARAVGASSRWIVLRHVVPNVLPAAMVVVSLLASTVILLEASLSFLGLGDPSVVSWGYLVNNAQRFIRTAWWMSLFPGAAIVLAVLGLNLLSDGISDVMNPAARARPRPRSRRLNPPLPAPRPAGPSPPGPVGAP